MTHQTNTRKCLAIQKEQGHEPSPNLFECPHCQKNQTTKANNLKHIKICKVKLKKEKENAQKKERDAQKTVQALTNDFEDRLEELASEFRTYKEETEYSSKLKDIKVETLQKEFEEFKRKMSGSTETKKTTNTKTNNSNSNNKTTNNSNNKTTTNSNNTTHITIQTVMTPRNFSKRIIIWIRYWKDRKD